LFRVGAGGERTPLSERLPCQDAWNEPRGVGEDRLFRILVQQVVCADGDGPRVVRAVDGIDLETQPGEFLTLLGPSGCGKTTMLNIMSGLLVPSHGKVLFDGRDVTRATPQDRNIAQVFQFPVIYDTMTVAENLAFPLKNRKVPEAQIKQRVGQIAEMLEMSGQLDQRAAGLAADAKQKISLGRGLVR